MASNPSGRLLGVRCLPPCSREGASPHHLSGNDQPTSPLPQVPSCVSAAFRLAAVKKSPSSRLASPWPTTSSGSGTNRFPALSCHREGEREREVGLGGQGERGMREERRERREGATERDYRQHQERDNGVTVQKQYSEGHYCEVQYSTAQHSTAQHSTAQHSTMLRWAPLTLQLNTSSALPSPSPALSTSVAPCALSH